MSFTPKMTERNVEASESRMNLAQRPEWLIVVSDNPPPGGPLTIHAEAYGRLDCGLLTA